MPLLCGDSGNSPIIDHRDVVFIQQCFQLFPGAGILCPVIDGTFDTPSDCLIVAGLNTMDSKLVEFLEGFGKCKTAGLEVDRLTGQFPAQPAFYLTQLLGQEIADRDDEQCEA